MTIYKASHKELQIVPYQYLTGNYSYVKTLPMVSGTPKHLANLVHLISTFFQIIEVSFSTVHPSKDEKSF